MAVNIQGGKSVSGIFHMALPRVHLCQGYMLYSALNGDGWLYSHLIQLKTPSVDPENRCITLKRGAPQWICYRDTCEIQCVWIHMVHVSEFVQGGCKEECLWAEGMFPQSLELDPFETREAINARSSELRYEAP